MLNERTNSGRGALAKIFGSLFFLVFFGAGCFFTYLMAKGFLYTLETRNWEQVPAHIDSVSITRNQKHDEDNTPYELTISYSYSVGSQTYHKNLTDDIERYSSYEEANEIASKYPQGSTQTCYVNPDDPSKALLFLESLWTGLFIFLPLLFVMVGGGGMYALWFGGKTRLSSTRTKSIARSTKARSTGDWVIWVVGGVFSFFGVIGTLFFGSMGVDMIRTQSWVKAPAHVLESAVIRHESSSDNGGSSYTYSIDIFYEYTFEGKTYRGSRYDLSFGSSSGYDSKKKIVDSYPTGKSFEVFVNPSNPEESAIQPGFSWFFLIVLFPLIFLIVGLLVLYSQVGKKSKSTPHQGTQPRSPVEQTFRSTPSHSSGEVVLKPQVSTIGKVIGVTLVCLFWNGIVSVFVYQDYKSWITGSPDWFLTLFLIPFVLIGLALIFGVFYAFLAAFNPVVELTVNTQSPELGSELEIKWNTTGNASRMKELVLSIKAYEEVKYRRGTNTVTDQHTFFEKEITRVTQAMTIQRGSVRVEVPRDQMHSFSHTNNKIIWKLDLRGDIPRWPDVTESYELHVQPMRL